MQNKKFIRYLKKIGFVSITADISTFVNYKKKIIIGIYIDNIIYAAKELQLLDKFEAQLSKEFEIKFYNKVRLILSILVKQDIKQKTLYFSYIHYI